MRSLEIINTLLDIYSRKEYADAKAKMPKQQAELLDALKDEFSIIQHDLLFIKNLYIIIKADYETFKRRLDMLEDSKPSERLLYINLKSHYEGLCNMMEKYLEGISNDIKH